MCIGEHASKVKQLTPAPLLIAEFLVVVLLLLAMSDSTAKVFAYFPIVLNQDGTTKRLFEFPTLPSDPNPSSPSPVLSKDLPLNSLLNTSLRIFLPRCRHHHHEPPVATTPKPKLPLIIYFHGGGFVTCSKATTGFHKFCVEMAFQVGVIILSVDYRLAPEHRLPAAYEDAVEALRWVRHRCDDPWMVDCADFSNCFLMGTSAGGNIAFHAGLRAAAEADDLVPLKIKGLVLHHPYFGGVKRTGSELRLINDSQVPLYVNDLQWKLSLPVGADRDHEYCNPTVAGESPSLEVVSRLRWKVMVTGGEEDPLVDSQKELVKVLEKKGVEVRAKFGEGDHHTVELMDPTKANAFFVILRDFFFFFFAS
ncbi:unnamed protein product [Camellia sinensis]